MPRPRILFIRLGAIGDVVRTLPALHVVRKSLPGAFLAWVVEDRAMPVLRDHPELDEVILLDRDLLARELAEPGTFFGGLARAGRFARELRARRFTVSLDFQGTFKSGLVARAAGASVRAGYERGSVKEGNHLFNNRRIPLPAGPVHRVARNLALLEALGLRADLDGAAATLPLRDEDRAEADRALREAGAPGSGFILLYPGSSRLQAWKRYPARRFGEAARALMRGGAAVVVGPGTGEEEIAAEMREVAGPDLCVLPPTSLMGMAEVIRRAGLFIGGDTGPMHIASALGVPVLALFGPTDPALNAPWSPDHIVLDALASASPGRRPHDPSAFDSLSPGEIAAAALRCLASAAARGRRGSAVSGTPSAAPAARAH